MYSNKVNIKTRAFRTVLLVLSAALVMTAMTALPFATDISAKSLSVSAERFCTDSMRTEDAFIYGDANGTVTVSIAGDEPRVSMNVTPLEAETKANALRIVIRNDSESDSMTVDYVFKNSAHLSETGSYIVDISSGSDFEEYIIPIESVDSMTKLELTFLGGKREETVTIVSIGAISYYYDGREYFGNLLENTYDRATQTAEFSGTVSYETVLKYPDANIVLYRLNQNEIIEDIRFAHPYVKSTPMSLDFRFVFPIESTSESCSRYFAAVLTSDNKVIPLTAETYLKEKDATSGETVDIQSNKGIFKGIETNLYEGASENGTSVAFVDVHLDKLFSNSGNGYQYILDEGKEYYFDRVYVSALDAEISNYSSVGSVVYLRFIVDTDSYYFGHLERISIPGKVKYFAIKPENDEAVNNLFACTDFIVSRYFSKEYGTLGGVILGRSLDKAFEYNYCGSVSMSKYADMLARTYSIIRIALDRSSSDLEVILPLSDAVIGADVIISADRREKNYPSDLLADAVLGILDRYGTDISSLYFMLESDYSPVSFGTGGLQLSDDVMGADGCTCFIDEIKAFSEKYADLPDEIFYCWFPSVSLTAKQLLATYMYNYNILANTEKVRSYVVSVSERDELIDTRGYSEIAENFIFSTLKSTYKYADTYNNGKVGASALETIGISSWGDVIEGFDEFKTVKRNLLEQDILYSQSLSVKGSYLMWDFSVANGTNGWSVSDGCYSLSVYSPLDDMERCLVASFDLNSKNTFGADYACTVYRAPDSLLMKDVSSVSFELLIPGAEKSEGLYEVKITVGADNAVSESTGVVKSDETVRIYADISALDKVSYIKLGVRPLNESLMSKGTFCIKGISIHSNVYDDRELENKVLSGDIIDKNGNAPDELVGGAYGTVFTVITVSVVGVFGAWMAVLLLNKRSRRKDCA